MSAKHKSRILTLSVLIIGLIILINLPRFSTQSMTTDNEPVSEEIITEQDGIQISKFDTINQLKQNSETDHSQP